MKRLIIILLGIFYALWINQWGNNSFWLSMSYLNIILILIIFLVKKPLGFKIFFYSIFLISEFPRTLFDFQLSYSGNIEYYNIHTTSILGLSGSLFTLLAIFVISLSYLKGKSIVIDKKIQILLWFLFFMILSTIYSLLFNWELPLNLKYLISDLKPILALLVGLHFGSYFSLNKINALKIQDIQNIGLILGIKTILLLFSDLFFDGRVLLEFNNQPYLLFPILFTSFIITGKHKALNVLIMFFGAFSISRSIIFFISICYFYTLKFLIFSRNKGLKLLVLIPLILAFSFVFGIIEIPENILTFFFFKLKFFTEEIVSGDLSSSPGIRYFEFLNIVSDMSENIKEFFIGKGFGGFFEFTNEIPNEINKNDYSIDQISIGKYYKPHTFINYTLLKGGLIYFSFYVWLILSLYLRGKKFVKENNATVGFFLILLSFFSLNFYWKFEYMFLLGFLLNYNFYYEKNNFNSRTSLISKAQKIG